MLVVQELVRTSAQASQTRLYAQRAGERAGLGGPGIPAPTTNRPVGPARRAVASTGCWAAHQTSWTGSITASNPRAFCSSPMSAKPQARTGNLGRGSQTLATLVLIFAASQLFVHQLDATGPMLGLPATVTAACCCHPSPPNCPRITCWSTALRQGVGDVVDCRS